MHALKTCCDTPPCKSRAGWRRVTSVADRSTCAAARARMRPREALRVTAILLLLAPSVRKSGPRPMLYLNVPWRSVLRSASKLPRFNSNSGLPRRFRDRGGLRHQAQGTGYCFPLRESQEVFSQHLAKEHVSSGLYPHSYSRMKGTSNPVGVMKHEYAPRM